MNQDAYRHHVTRAAAAVRHLGGAVRGSRAFFIYRDRRDSSQPSVIACHPPLSDEAMLACLGNGQVVWESISDSDGHRALVGVATDAGFENRELAEELTLIAARSIADRPSFVQTVSSAILPDRAAFMEELDDLLRDVDGGHNDHVAALVVDVDHFHRVNSRFGEAGGDNLMRILARRIALCLPHGTLVARLGGDRIGVMVTVDRGHRAEAEALVTATAVHAALKEPVRIADEEIFVTASIGIALGGDDIRAGTLLHDADQAIATAKRSGGATTSVFRAGMNNVPVFQLLRERDVRLAVAREEFGPFFQPIVDVATGELRAFEALLRWHNPEEGTLPPLTFLDVLEETGLIEVVGRRMIEDSCKHAARWLALSGSRSEEHPSELQSRFGTS